MEPEVLQILNTDPTDMPVLELYRKNWVATGQTDKVSLLAYLMGEKLGKVEASQAEILKELKLLRNEIGDVKNVTPTSLANRLSLNPELAIGFTLTDVKGKPRLTYKGSKATAVLYTGYEQLHVKLMPFYGNKDITYKSISTGLIKHFLRKDIEAADVERVDLISEILNIADFLYYTSKLKRFTIPELKRNSNLAANQSSRELKNILLQAGWSIKTQGTCKVLLFCKQEP